MVFWEVASLDAVAVDSMGMYYSPEEMELQTCYIVFFSQITCAVCLTLGISPDCETLLSSGVEARAPEDALVCYPPPNICTCLHTASQNPSDPASSTFSGRVETMQ